MNHVFLSKSRRTVFIPRLSWLASVCVSILERLPAPRTSDRHVTALLDYLRHIPRLQQLLRTERLLAANVSLAFRVLVDLRLTAHYLDLLQTRLEALGVRDKEAEESLGCAWNEVGSAEYVLMRTLEPTHELIPGAFEDWRWAQIRPRPVRLERNIGYFCKDFTSRFRAAPDPIGSSDQRV